MFSFEQAVACADAGITLISPFVGRTSDWHRKDRGVDGFAPEDDPGSQLVTRIYNYYKRHGHDTVVMGASFRNTGQILQLAGCDLLTISPTLMEELMLAEGEVPRMLDADRARDMEIGRTGFDETAFRWAMNENPMATEKLAEGIRRFAADADKLQAMITA
jgi:transaldolase